MEKEKIKIEINLDTKLFLEVAAKRCGFKNVSEYLDAIMDDIDLCGMIENYLKYQADSIEFF